MKNPSHTYTFIHITVASLLNMLEAGMYQAKQTCKDAKCAELGWVSIPLAVGTYGCWGTEAKWVFSQHASLLGSRQNCLKSIAIAALYGRLNLTPEPDPC